MRNFVKWLLRFGLPIPRQWIFGYLEWSLIRTCLDAYQINCVLDVGANSGQYAMNLRRIGYRGRICSFEPIDHDYNIMSRHFAHDPNWHGFPIALGNTNTEQILNVAKESTAMSSFLQPNDASWQLERVTVPMRRLDAVFGEAIAGIQSPKVMLKTDAQGYDLEVVRGALGCIEKIICLQSEVTIIPIYEMVPHYLDVLSEYERLGFQLISFSEVFRQETSASIVEANCLFVRSQQAKLLESL